VSTCGPRSIAALNWSRKGPFVLSAPTATYDIAWVPIDDLHPDPANPRKISDAELDALTSSIREFGLVQPILATRHDGKVVGGHQRLLAACRLGLTSVPVIFLDLDPDQAHLLNLALNRIGGEWDEALLGRLLHDLQLVPDVDLSLSGFGDDEITKYLKQLEAEDKHDRPEAFDPDQALEEAKANPVTQPGDLWLLGDHRLLCGDSTSPADVERLMHGRLASLLATDPPYLVDYAGDNHLNGGGGSKGKPTKVEANWDEFQGAEAGVDFFVRYLKLALVYLKLHSAIYQWHATRRQVLVEQAWVKCGLLVHQTIIWAKPRGVLTHSHYLWSHEPCFYGWLEGPPPSKKPPANVKTVWEISQQGERDEDHRTQKPVELFLRPIEHHTEAGDVVYESFSGSGTQLIAAGRTGRLCFAMEQSPLYVDLAVRRWEAFSGETAVREAAATEPASE
jgi:DNA modification methylase